MLNDRKRRPGFNRPDTHEDQTKELVRLVLLSLNPEVWPSFIQTVANDYAPDVRERLHLFIKSLICSFAGQTDLSQSDAHVVEDCRKICDLMGWLPETR